MLYQCAIDSEFKHDMCHFIYFRNGICQRFSVNLKVTYIMRRFMPRETDAVPDNVWCAFKHFIMCLNSIWPALSFA